MANALTLTALTEVIFSARDSVAREIAGFIPAVLINSAPDGVSINGTVNSYRTSEPTLNTSYAPAMTIPAGDDQTLDVDTMTIGQVANVKIPMRGEDFRKLDNTVGRKSLEDMFAQGIRKIVNAIEAHIGTVADEGASRAYGTAATTPFASDHKSINSIRQILVDNGCPMDGQVSLVLNTLAGTNLRNLSTLYGVNNAGSDILLRQGVLQDISGIMLRESAGVASHTKGTGASATTNNAGYAIGATTLTLAAAGTGTVVAGDCITHARDSANIYVVGTGDADVSDGGTIVLNRPGLRLAVTAATSALTVGGAYTANVAFHRAAIELAMRPPAMPEGGDAATDRLTISCDRTGLVFEIALYKGYGMVMYDMTCFYQAKVWKPEFVANLLG